MELGDAIDVGKAREITVTILVTSLTLGGGTAFEVAGMTAAVNNETYYGSTDDSPISFSDLTDGKPTVFVGKFSTFSRFWLPRFKVTGGSPSGESSFSCTIDVVVR